LKKQRATARIPIAHLA